MDRELAAMPIIDVDSHYTEPRDLWTSRAPQKLRDQVPRVTETPEGVEQMDQNMVNRGGLKLRPREYFQRQMYGSYWFETANTRNSLEQLGGDNVMFETDFPHPTCLYPEIREQVQSSLAGFDRSLQRKVLYETAARVYNLPLPITSTQSA